MTARPATIDDASEVVRLAAVMYASMGLDVSDPIWIQNAVAHFTSRLSDDLTVFVVDHPEGNGLAASAAGTISIRLPAPNRSTPRVGYVQWVATNPDLRSRGYGRTVMTALLDWFDRAEVGVVELHATIDGEPLYRGLGFTDEGPVALRRRL